MSLRRLRCIILDLDVRFLWVRKYFTSVEKTRTITWNLYQIQKSKKKMIYDSHLPIFLLCCNVMYNKTSQKLKFMFIYKLSYSWEFLLHKTLSYKSSNMLPQGVQIHNKMLCCWKELIFWVNKFCKIEWTKFLNF